MVSGVAQREASRRRIDAAIEHLADRVANHFPVRRTGLRRIGREAEFPIVLPDGRAGDVSRLWEPLIGSDHARIKYDDPSRAQTIVRVDLGPVGYEIEVGRATAEVVLPPVDDLAALEAASRPAIARLTHAAAARRLRVLGYGIQPRTIATAGLMTPKRRYFALHRAIGRPWLHFATTASDQVQVDISRSELLDAINLMNLMSGPLIALCANSSVYGGRVGRFVSGREGMLETLGDERHGMTPRRFPTLEDYVAFMCGRVCYVLPQRGRYIRYGRPFTHYLAERGADFDAYLWHEHYTWNSARPRVQNGTIEIRPACQQPPDEPLAASALAVALVEALPDLWAFVHDRLGADPWPAMARYRADVVRRGLRAREPAPRFLAGLVAVCDKALRRRGRGEERFLKPIRRRLDERALPADRAVAHFRRGGVRTMVERLAL
jgi:gamma-glutamylcysteine synthetase